jgi:hypothetical protein
MTDSSDDNGCGGGDDEGGDGCGRVRMREHVTFVT